MYKAKKLKDAAPYYRTHVEVSNEHALPILERIKENHWIKDVDTVIMENTTSIYFLADKYAIEWINSWFNRCEQANGDYWNRK